MQDQMKEFQVSQIKECFKTQYFCIVFDKWSFRFAVTCHFKYMLPTYNALKIMFDNAPNLLYHFFFTKCVTITVSEIHFKFIFTIA